MTTATFDVVIVGAGMAGLSAALKLKRHGLRYLIVEAQPHLGGRAASIRTRSGIPVDLGAHWLHGKNTPLKALLDRYRLAYEQDKAKHMRVYRHGERHDADVNKWLKQCIDRKKAARVKKEKIPDCAVPELAVDDEAYDTLDTFAALWDGLDPPLKPSAREFLTDKNKPGGLQVQEGLGTLFRRMLAEAGEDFIRLERPVASLESRNAHVEICTRDGHAWRARRAIFTGSLAVIKSGMVSFAPALSNGFREALSHIAMGKMNKIVVEMPPEFFTRRGIPVDFALELLDARPPQFCHAHSAGKPLINLFISGPKAQEVETLSPKQALEHMRKTLAPVRELAGFETQVKGRPILSRWVSNPYSQGAYSACLPGGRRSLPQVEGNVCFAGDTFDTAYPASLAGASRSGKAAALIVAGSL